MYNISDFYKTSDYLPLFNGVLITDIIVIIVALTGITFQSQVLFNWYKKYTLEAVIADVFIIVLGLILARYLYPKIFSEFSLIKFIGLAVIIQIIHDILFYQLVLAIPRNKSAIIDTFYEYGKENGAKAIIADSMMMILASILFSYFGNKSLNTNIITLISSIYITVYLINSF
jgi:hypothetical protein